MVARSAIEPGFGAARTLPMLSPEKHEPLAVKLASASSRKGRCQDMDYALCSTGESIVCLQAATTSRSGLKAPYEAETI